MQNKIWIAAKYLRLSIEDGDKAESESIVNQSIMIDNYMKTTSDITIVETFKDDGFSGTDFNRPGFQAMLKAIENKEINCVIVKDLSRFGREHIDVDRYIQKVFPKLGVRFIAINDNYDSETANITDTHLVLPVKSFVNDTYCRQNSQKVRSHLEAKRNIGEYVGNYVSYGYKKCTADKSQIEIDPVAAKHVRNIFAWKQEGMSNQMIADKLNALGVLAPADYKRTTGVNFKSSFQTHLSSKWSAVAVIRILKNPIYYGVLQQGKSQRVNYKVKVQRALPEKDWVVIKNHHPGIVTETEFETVQKLLEKDTRVAPGEDRLYMFGGLLVCGDCESNLIRRTNSYKGEKTVFYICSSYNKKKDQCTRHSIREDVLIKLVKNSMMMYCETADSIRSAVDYLKENSLDTQVLVQHDDQILELRNKLNKYYKLLHSLSGNLAKGIISKEDYTLLRDRYQAEIKNLEMNIEKQEEYIEDLLNNKLMCEEWVETFLEKPGFGELQRDTLLQFIEKIKVFEDKRIEIVYRFQDELIAASRIAARIEKSRQEVAV
jgi:DNA invertase Pin-like site-specific DNA recombinase